MEQSIKKRRIRRIVKRIIIIVVTLYIFSVVYKFLIIKKIYNETDKNISKENYVMHISTTIDGNTTKTSSYYRNGRGKSIASNGVYKWTNQKYYFVIDEEKKIISDLDMTKLNDVTGIATNSSFAAFIPGYFKPAKDKIKMVLAPRTILLFSKVDGELCYYLNFKEDGNSKSYWISKKKYVPKRATINIADKKVEYDFDISFLNATVEDTEFIDVTGYTFIDSSTGEQKNAEDIFKDE